MAKLTAAQSRAIETVLYHLNRANDYLNKPDVILARTKDMQTTTLDFILPDGKVAFKVDKQIGSDIAGLEMGISYLNNFLTFHRKD